MKRKIRFAIPAIIFIVLLALIIPYGWAKVNAVEEPPYQVNILEIVDQNDYSVLKGKLNGTPNVNVDVMRMKTFVAMREDLSGKYDAIYLANAYELKDSNNKTKVKTGISTNYSTGPVASFNKSGDTNNQKAAHQTSFVMNDITQLKADEIKRSFISQGLPVIVHKNVLQQQPNASGKRILYDTFNKYFTHAESSPNNNVYFVNDTELNQLVTQIQTAGSSLYQQLHQRPRIQLTVKPDEYNGTSSSRTYKAGDTLIFRFNTFNVQNLSDNRITAKLYLSVDKVLQYTDENQVALKTITQSSGNELTYNLPKAYSGLLYWKLDVSNSITGLIDSVSGTIRYQDEKTVVRVLQVMPDSGSGSSLLMENNMKQAYLKSDDYELRISPISFKDLKSMVAANKEKTLNGKYDMVVFGFKDSYNEGSTLNADTASVVHDFITSGQGVMFTHDTIYKSTNSSNPWVDNFQTDTGQIIPETNLGFGNPVGGTSTKAVNNGLLTQFPFDLSKTPASGSIGQIATTHNQYFTLDLEDKNVVSWYNINSSDRDVDDSWNHYYTYTKGNVTYSGTGHTSSGFPNWEQRLFVNTMYRAFIGANHAPEITVISPKENAVIPSYQKIPVSYTVNDLDLKDRNIKTQVKIVQDQKELKVYEEKTVLSGSTLSLDLDNPLKDVKDQGKLQIVITARDLHGAQAEPKTINITVIKAKDSLQVDRSLPEDKREQDVFTNESLLIDYTIKPVAIPIEQGTKDPAKMIVTELRFNEKLPPNLEVGGIQLDSAKGSIQKTGTLKEGYQLTGALNNVKYHLSTDGKSYITDDNDVIRFTVPVTPKEKGNYLLDQSTLGFRDFDEKTKTASFPVISFTAKKRLTSLSIGEEYTILKGSSLTLPVTYEPKDVDPRSLVFSWSSADPRIASVDDQGKVTGMKAGVTTVTVRSTDGSKLSASAKVTVFDPILTLKAPDKIKVNQMGKLQAVMEQKYLQNVKLTWRLSGAGDDARAGLKDTGDEWSRDLKGLAVGNVNVEVTLEAELAGSSTKVKSIASAQVLIIHPLESISIKGPTSVVAGKSIVLTPVLNPEDAENVPPLVWSLKGAEDSKYASLRVTPEGVIVTGKQKGTVVVQLTAGDLQAEHKVEIQNQFTGLRLSNPISIMAGSDLDLQTKLELLPHGEVNDELDIRNNKLIWKSDNPLIFTVNPDTGVIHAIREGTAYVTVVYKEDPAITATAKIIVQRLDNEDKY
ncbi:DUF5057 domain-containing protein [Paenibacillus sp. HJL G12]|uniref:DUF5057 domain-containing protein n=1 Tax=Paenibacillus dendrobii TaxID=2691084 RepID=A0A7X3IN55_9BACL|nr:DUF5057 domain-containing protein [Paenibacillus dendrobii]MWV46645.1 DUF5057 domain-containing protein [Paenibacillus dendrobii]